MPAIPPEPPRDAREHLGRLLLRRRRELGYENRTDFARATGINLRLAQDVETAAGYRPRLRAKTKDQIEDAYRLEPGSVDAALAGGELGLLPPPPDPVDDLLREIWGRHYPDGVPDVVRVLAAADPGVLDTETKLTEIRAYARRFGLLNDGNDGHGRRDRPA